jgi:peptidoglycan/xylan/chitin deacetylase (PgdA/CDA1 family)
MAKRINLRVQLPRWFSKLYPEAIWRLTKSEKTAYLTFDDGPVTDVTLAVLNILREKSIKATFFCVGDNVSRYPEIYRQIIDEGHAVGNHTYNHLHGLKNTNSDYFANIEKAAALIRSDLFRPPYGLMKSSQYKELINRYRIIMWDVISCDYDPVLTPDQCYNNVVDFVRDGSIITFHDSLKAKKNILTALPLVIDQLIKEGYSFKKIEFNTYLPDQEEAKAKPLLHTRNTVHKVRKRA